MWFWLAVSTVLITSLFAVLAVVFSYVDRAKRRKYLIAAVVSGGIMIAVLSLKPFLPSLEQANINMYQYFLQQHSGKNQAAQVKQEKKDQQQGKAAAKTPADQKSQPAKEIEAASSSESRKATDPKTEKTSAGQPNPASGDTDKTKLLIVVGSGTEKQNPPAAESKNEPPKPGGNTRTVTPAPGGTPANTPAPGASPAGTAIPAPGSAQTNAPAPTAAPAGAPSPAPAGAQSTAPVPGAAPAGTTSPAPGSAQINTPAPAAVPAGTTSPAVKRGQIIHHANFRTSEVIGQVAKVLPPGTIVDLIDPYNPNIMIKVRETSTGMEGWVFGQFVSLLN